MGDDPSSNPVPWKQAKLPTVQAVCQPHQVVTSDAAVNTPIDNQEFLKALALAIVSLIVSAMLLIPAHLLLVPRLHPQFLEFMGTERAGPIAISGDQFQPVIFGDGGFEGSSAVISMLAEADPDDHAVLLLRRKFEARDFPFLRYNIEGRTPALRLMLFWQRADAPGENHYAELDHAGHGEGIHNLVRSEAWKGTITELAIGLFGDLRTAPVKVHGVELEPYSYTHVLRTVWQEWTTFAAWNQRSINAYRGVPDAALTNPVTAIAAWLATSLSILLLILQVSRRDTHRGRFWLPAAIATGIAWVALDALWLHQLFRQSSETRYLFAGKTLHEKKLADWDGDYYLGAQAIKEMVSGKTKNVLILYQEDQAALAQRMRFHLLPQVMATSLRTPSASWIRRANQRFDYVVLISEPGNEPQSGPLFRAALDHASVANWGMLWAQGPVALYTTNRAPQASDA